MVVGVGVTLIPAWLQSRCQLPTGPGIVASCQSYTPYIHWGFFILVLGAAFLVSAAVSATNRIQRR